MFQSFPLSFRLWQMLQRGRGMTPTPSGSLETAPVTGTSGTTWERKEELPNSSKEQSASSNSCPHPPEHLPNSSTGPIGPSSYPEPIPCFVELVTRTLLPTGWLVELRPEPIVEVAFSLPKGEFAWSASPAPSRYAPTRRVQRWMTVAFTDVLNTPGRAGYVTHSDLREAWTREQWKVLRKLWAEGLYLRIFFRDASYNDRSFRFHVAEVRARQNETENCAICMEHLGEDDPLPCGHSVHASCLRQWRPTRPECPVCHQPITERNPLPFGRFA